MTETPLTPIEIGLTAAIVAVEGGEPAILVAGDGESGEARAGLPFGPFDPVASIVLVLMTAVLGFCGGYVGSLVWNRMQ